MGDIEDELPDVSPLLNDGDSTDATDEMWAIYCSKAVSYDLGVVQAWRDDMEGILIFSGLFSAVITAFLVESYKTLKTDSGDLTVALLAQVSHQLAATSDSARVIPPGMSPEQMPFYATSSALRTNFLWFLSLSLSLATAFVAILVKQWVRNYLAAVVRHPMARKRARVRAYLYEGLQSFGMPGLITVVPTLLHISLFLFFAGLVEFLLPLNSIIAALVLVILAICVTLYCTIAVLPIIWKNCPYHTPLATVAGSGIRALILGAGYCLLFVFSFGHSLERHRILSALSQYDRKIRFRVSVERAATTPSPGRDARDTAALYWMADTLVEKSEWEHFLSKLPDFLRAIESSKSSNVIKGSRHDDMFLHHLVSLMSSSRIQIDPELCLSALCAFLNFLASNKRCTPYTAGDLHGYYNTYRIPPGPGPQCRCLIAAMMAHHFGIANRMYREEGTLFSYMALARAIKYCQTFASARTADLWFATVEHNKTSATRGFDRFDAVPDDTKAVFEEARLLALIDFVIALTENSPVPTEAQDALPLVIVDLDTSQAAPALQTLFVNVVQEFMRPRLPEEMEMRVQRTLVNHVIPLLGTLTDRAAVDKAKEILTSYMESQMRSAAAVETLAVLEDIQYPSPFALARRHSGSHSTTTFASLFRPSSHISHISHT